MCLLAAGCATTSSQTATAHKPQMITGEEEHEATLKLPDGIATVLNFVGGLATGFAPESW